MAQSHAGKRIRSPTVSFKVEMVEWSRGEGMQNVTRTAKKYGVDRKEENKEYDKCREL